MVISRVHSILVFITLLFAATLGVFVAFSYIPRENELVKGGCIIVSAQKSSEYMVTNRGVHYFYKVGTGSRKNIWIEGTYKTIDVYYRTPDNYDPEYIFSYTDGYTSETERNKVFDSIVFNETQTRCWYNPNNKNQVSVTKEAQMQGQIAGVVIFTVLTFVMMCVTCIVSLLK
jgi:hypothetical protein